MLACPHCNERTISPIRKLLFGPIFEHRCAACRKHWGISHWSIVVAVVAVVAYSVFLHVAQPALLAARIGGAVMLVSTALALVFLVPVVRK